MTGRAWSVARHIYAGLALLAIAPVAQAHGEEILLPFGLHLASVLGCLGYLQFTVARRLRALCLCACVAAVALSEVLMSRLPYRENELFFTCVTVGAPIVATVLSLALRRAWIRRGRRLLVSAAAEKK